MKFVVKFIAMETARPISESYEALPTGLIRRGPLDALEWELEGRDEGGFPLPKDELRFLYEIAAWKRGAPPLADRTRRADLHRLEPLQAPGWPDIHCIQFKGIGFRSGQKVIQPSTQFPYEPPTPPGLHGSIDKSGSWKIDLPMIEPLGGWTAGARNEFASLVTLHKAGVPVPIPIRYGESLDRRWQGKSLELGMWGLPCKEERRIGDRLQSWLDSPSELEKAPLRPDEVPDFVLELTRGISKLVARIQREAGLVGLQAHPANFTYDFPTNTLMAHDFETARRADKMTSVQAGVWTLNDISILLRKALMILVHMDLVELGRDDSYKGTVLKEALDSLYEGQEGLKKEFVEQMLKILKLISISMQGPHPELFFGVLMNRTYHIMLPRLCELHQNSEVGKQYPISITPNQVALNYAIFEAMCNEFGRRVSLDGDVYESIYKPNHRPEALLRIVREIEAMRTQLTPLSPPPTRI